uniref:Ciliary microtubule inner protein 2B n=1 Tax=Ursus maritimus TaxID=29073 RepID=A0A452TKV6_URSMA
MPAPHIHPAESRRKRSGLQRSVFLSGGGGGARRGEWVSALLQVHWTLPTTSGQTYGQMTGQLLRGFPGLAWPPAHRTLLPPIRPPASPEVPRGSLPVRRGHERLSSSMIPGYTGFVPQAQFIFAKNCSRVWAEALNDFTQGSVGQGSQELPKEDKGKKDVEKDQEPKPEPELEAEKEPELGQEADQASPYSMDDKDPRKFFMPGFTGYVPRARFLFGSSFPVLTNRALQEFGQMYSGGRPQKDPKHLPPLSRTYPQNLGLLPNYGGYVPGENSSRGDCSIFVCVWNGWKWFV